MLNNKLFIQETLVRDRKGALQALVYPDYETIDKMAVSEQQLRGNLQGYKLEVNEKMPSYMNIAEIEIVPEEFEKTPKKSIKRFLYTLDQ